MSSSSGKATSQSPSAGSASTSPRGKKSSSKKTSSSSSTGKSSPVRESSRDADLASKGTRNSSRASSRASSSADLNDGNTPTTTTTASATVASSVAEADAAQPGSNVSMEELLNRISKLEQENAELKKHQEGAKLLNYLKADVYANLTSLQDNLKEKIRIQYNKLREQTSHLPPLPPVPTAMFLHNMPRLDLKPWIELAAKSRNIDVQDITKAISRKNRQLIACIVTFMLLPMSMAMTALWCYIAIFVDKSRIALALLLIYGTIIYFDTSFERGSRAVMWVKQHWFWRLLCNYFPILLVKQNVDTIYDPNEVYLFGYHPHGIISVGCFVSFAADATGASDLFPGIKIHPATLNANFFIPFWRELLLKLGVIGVSAKSLKYVLSKGPGNAALVVPGGAAEALDARPGKHALTLQRRQGFFRIALQHGACLVPIYSFGENDLYEQVANDEGSCIRKIQNIFLKYAGFATPFFSGAGSGGAAIPMNPIPARKPVVTVVGNPIKCPIIEHPTQADIDHIRALYVEKLQEIFMQFADKYAPERSSDLQIVK